MSVPVWVSLPNELCLFKVSSSVFKVFCNVSDSISFPEYQIYMVCLYCAYGMVHISDSGPGRTLPFLIAWHSKCQQYPLKISGKTLSSTLEAFTNEGGNIKDLDKHAKVRITLWISSKLLTQLNSSSFLCPAPSSANFQFWTSLLYSAFLALKWVLKLLLLNGSADLLSTSTLPTTLPKAFTIPYLCFGST